MLFCFTGEQTYVGVTFNCDLYTANGPLLPLQQPPPFHGANFTSKLYGDGSEGTLTEKRVVCETTMGLKGRSGREKVTTGRFAARGITPQDGRCSPLIVLLLLKVDPHAAK